MMVCFPVSTKHIDSALWKESICVPKRFLQILTMKEQECLVCWSETIRQNQGFLCYCRMFFLPCGIRTACSETIKHSREHASLQGECPKNVKEP